MIISYLVHELILIQGIIFFVGIFSKEISPISYLIFMSFFGYGICYVIFDIISLKHGISIKYFTIVLGFLLLLVYIWFICYFKPSNDKGVKSMISLYWTLSLDNAKSTIWVLLVSLITCLIISDLGEGYNDIKVYWRLIIIVTHIIFCINIKKSTRQAK